MAVAQRQTNDGGRAAGGDPVDSFRLTGKTAIVTGASSGLGAGFAVAMAKAGARVAVGARRVEPLADTVVAIRHAGKDAMASPLDVSDPRSCQRFVEAVARAWGRIDIFVNNAG